MGKLRNKKRETGEGRSQEEREGKAEIGRDMKDGSQCTEKR